MTARAVLRVLTVMVLVFTADRAACRVNMTNLATSMEMFYASNGKYPDQLEELRAFGGTGLECSACHIPYRYIISDNGSDYTITCPNVPSHGSISDGYPDWH